MLPFPSVRSLFSLLGSCLIGFLVFSLTGCGQSGGTAEQNTATQTTGAGSQAKPVSEAQRVPEELKNVPELVAAGKSQEALKILGDWIGAHPQDPRGYTFARGVQANLGQRDAAVGDLNKMVELTPNDADALHSRGLFYLMNGPKESARADLEAALKIDPKHENAASHLGVLKLSLGEYLPAIQAFDIAIQANSKDLSYFNNRGLAYWRAGNPALARADFDTALQLNPRDSNTLSNRGQLSLHEKKYEAAVSDFTTAISNDPYNMEHFRFRHAAYLKLGRLVDANNNGRHIVWLRKVFQLQEEARKRPDDLKKQIELGRHLAVEHDYAMALKVFDLVLAKSPNEIPALLGRAEILLNRKEYQKVIDDCSAVLKLEPSSFDAHSFRGDAWFELRKYDEAIADYDAAKRFDRQVSDAYYLRSQQRASAGDQAGAAADLAKSKEMAPKLQTAEGVE